MLDVGQARPSYMDQTLETSLANLLPRLSSAIKGPMVDVRQHVGPLRPAYAFIELIYIYIYIYICKYHCMYACLHVCMYAYLFFFLSIYTYIHLSGMDNSMRRS